MGQTEFNKDTKDTIKYFFSQLLQEGLIVLRGLFLPNILAPFYYGIVSTLNIIEKYSSYVNLGIHHNILYKVPFYRGKGEFEEIEKVKIGCYYFTLFTGFLAAIVIIAVALLNYSKLNINIFWGLLILSSYPLFLTLRGVYMLLLRADKNFDLITKILNITALLSFVLVIILGFFFKSNGVFLGQIIASLLCILILIRTSGYNFHFQINLKKIVELLKFSIPIVFIIEIIKIFLLTIDRLIVLKYLGIYSVGLYTIGLSLSSLATLLPNSIAAVASPTLVEEYGKPSGNPTDYFLTMLYFISITVAFCVAIISILSPAIIKIIFPKYELGIKSAQILPFAVYFEGIGMLAFQVLILMNKMKRYIISLIFCSIFAFLGLNYTFFNKNILFVSMFIVMLSFLKNTIIIIMASALVFRDFKKSIAFACVLFAIFLFIILLCFFLDYFFPGYSSLNNLELIEFSFFKVLLFSFFYMFIVLYFDRNTKFINKFYFSFINILKKKIYFFKNFDSED